MAAFFDQLKKEEEEEEEDEEEITLSVKSESLNDVLE